MAGRPINEDRVLALTVTGDKTYIGREHTCGTCLRYVKGGACVFCARVLAKDQREALRLQKTGTMTLVIDDISAENVAAAFNLDYGTPPALDKPADADLTEKERVNKWLEDIL